MNKQTNETTHQAQADNSGILGYQNQWVQKSPLHAEAAFSEEEKEFEERQIIFRGPTSRERNSWNSSPGPVPSGPQFPIGYPLPSDYSEKTQALLLKMSQDLSFFTLAGCRYNSRIRINPDLDGIMSAQIILKDVCTFNYCPEFYKPNNFSISNLSPCSLTAKDLFPEQECTCTPWTSLCGGLRSQECFGVWEFMLEQELLGPEFRSGKWFFLFFMELMNNISPLSRKIGHFFPFIF